MLPPEVQKSKEGEEKERMAAWRGTVRVTEMDFFPSTWPVSREEPDAKK